MNAKILIADDESDIVSMLGNFFESKGFRVLPAFNGAEALKQVEKQPDIILLDINMPGTDGLEVCKRIRDHISCPILFLTARIEDTDKVKGFAVGGDDYIVKPFSLVELDARVRAHLRREARHNFEAQVKFSGDLTIDYSERCLFFGDKRVGLAKREFDIVELLSQNPGQIFDKERIYERIWGYDSEGDSSVVAEHIRRIRTKIAAYVALSHCGFALNAPFCSALRELHVDGVPHIIRNLECFRHKFLDNLRGKPCGTQTHINFRRFQVFRLRFKQCLRIDSKFRVRFSSKLSRTQLCAHIAGKVLIRHLPSCFRVGRVSIGIFENHAG